jgi:hypothetical protein
VAVIDGFASDLSALVTSWDWAMARAVSSILRSGRWLGGIRFEMAGDSSRGKKRETPASRLIAKRATAPFKGFRKRSSEWSGVDRFFLPGSVDTLGRFGRQFPAVFSLDFYRDGVRGLGCDNNLQPASEGDDVIRQVTEADVFVG